MPGDTPSLLPFLSSLYGGKGGRKGRKEGGREEKKGGRRSKVSPFDSRQKKEEEEKEEDVTFFSLSLSLCHFWERVN